MLGKETWQRPENTNRHQHQDGGAQGQETVDQGRVHIEHRLGALDAFFHFNREGFAFVLAQAHILRPGCFVIQDFGQSPGRQIEMEAILQRRAHVGVQQRSQTLDRNQYGQKTEFGELRNATHGFVKVCACLKKNRVHASTARGPWSLERFKIRLLRKRIEL